MMVAYAKNNKEANNKVTINNIAEDKREKIENTKEDINNKFLNDKKELLDNEKNAKYVNDAIILDPDFVDSKHKKGIIEIPFKLFHFGNRYQKYYVEIYNSSNKKVAEKSNYFPEGYGPTNLTLTWDTTNVPSGTYYIRHWSTRNSELKDYLYPFHIEGNKDEYFNTTISGRQNAENDNLSNPLTAWKLTSATHQRYSFYDEIPYEIRLEEMYTGNEAASIVEYENMFNDKPTSSQQWTLMKFYLKNNGNKKLEASDIISSNYFYTKNGAKMRIIEMATFSADKSGQGIYDLDLYSGADGYCWIGILTDKSQGLPLLQISNGYSGEARYSWLNTDPNYKPTQTGWVNENGAWHYIESNGYKATGWKLVDSSWYYFNELGVMQTGWLSLGGQWYYLNSSGAMLKGWLHSGGKWYYFNSSGAMQKNWVQVGNTWYYMNSSGEMQTGWLSLGGTWYYLNSSGAMQTGWLHSGGKWYYFNGSGAMQKNWVQVGNRWYYMRTSGEMETGWLNLGGTWYYMNSSGAMQTGWLSLGGTWYYFEPSGSMVTGWKLIDNTWYYFYESGAMK